MGEKRVSSPRDSEQLRSFMKCLLTDLRALERMLAEGQVESDRRRVGAEQELVLVDARWHPAPVAVQVLERIDDKRFTTELARFNLEFNLEPLSFGGDCLGRLERELTSALETVRSVAAGCDAKVLLTGILPSIRKSDLELDNMTPRERYFALNDAIRRMRGSAFEFRFTGTDELIIRHDSVMLEACNTSSQFHFQVGPGEFARFYNIAQAVAGPVLAAAVNSPLLFGRRLWRETRIALFQQAVDTRRPGLQLEHRSARVRFGSGWVRESVLEIFREDVARFRAVLAIDIDEDPLEVLERGGVPRLQALQLHNSTVYRWIRACYGVFEGRPHLRIENRVLPSGPTVVDEVANAALWFGLISGLSERIEDITERMSFDTARTNFLAAAHWGLDCHLEWIGGKRLPAQTLLLDELLPMAREGLAAAGIRQEDIDRYLGIIEARVESGRTGARWLLDAYDTLKICTRRGSPVAALTEAMYRCQETGRPVHTWDLPKVDTLDCWTHSYQYVGQYMTTDVFTVHQDEVIDLVASLMDWEHIRHVPVEDDEERLVGLISYRQLLRFLAHDLPHGRGNPVAAGQIMQRDPITVTPETATLEAIEIMRRHRVPCLPVVDGQRLVGIVTERDFLGIAGHLFEERIRQS